MQKVIQDFKIENKSVLIESPIYCDICGDEIKKDLVMALRKTYFCGDCEDAAIHKRGIIPQWVRIRRWNVKK